jgi:putative DNA primase/helicase
MGCPRAPLAGRNRGGGCARLRGRRPHSKLCLPDIAAVAAAALPHLPDLCRSWLPGGRLVGREWTCGSLRGEPGLSCKVNIATGRWADFATGHKGGDAVSLAAAIHRLSQREAADRIAVMLGLVGGGSDGR